MCKLQPPNKPTAKQEQQKQAWITLWEVSVLPVCGVPWLWCTIKAFSYILQKRCHAMIAFPFVVVSCQRCSMFNPIASEIGKAYIHIFSLFCQTSDWLRPGCWIKVIQVSFFIPSLWCLPFYFWTFAIWWNSKPLNMSIIWRLQRNYITIYSLHCTIKSRWHLTVIHSCQQFVSFCST